jgi:RTX calcium-binding nonapeptide repeat (4 copies)/Subtilase family
MTGKTFDQLIAEKILNTQKRLKATPELQNLQTEYQSYLDIAAQSRSRQDFQSSNPSLNANAGYVVVDATASSDSSKLLSDLRSIGLLQGSSYGRVVSGLLPINAIDDVSGLASLKSIQPAYKSITNVGAVNSQGDLGLRANVARTNFSVNGTGVKVGVLSDSYNLLLGAAADIASGDLPAVVQVIQEGVGINTDEGRAMLQIVHDIAPGASLAFATAFLGQASFANNIINLKNAGAKVIVDDVFNFAEPFFQDGIIAQAVNTVVGEGVAYFSAAGNAASQSYQSSYRSAPDSIFPGQFHDFNPGIGSDTRQRFTLANGESINLSFQWDNSSFSASGVGPVTDLDIALLAGGTDIIVAAGFFDNFATGEPIEFLAFTNNSGAPANFDLIIKKFAGPDPSLIKYVDFSGGTSDAEFFTNSSTIVGHANAAGAAAVGAARYNQSPAFGQNPPLLEGFSAKGGTPILFNTNGTPTNINRPKPEFSAIDGTDNTFFGGNDFDSTGFPNFFGTSAAAPHAAAVAALIIQAIPTASPTEIYNALRGTAIDINTVGFDNLSGAGLIQADAAIALLLPLTPTAGTVTRPVFSGGNLSLGTNAADVIVGSINGDTIAGFAGNDLIDAGSGNDSIDGGFGNDSIFGGSGNDTLIGNIGDDTLSGVIRGVVNFGIGEQDRLIGGAGIDRFVLGDGIDFYYSDSNIATAGLGDFATIVDFQIEDRIQLRGAATNYAIGSASVGGTNGVGIFLDDDGIVGLSANDELIAILPGIVPASLNLVSSNFIYT